jgi:drug/metabolite transporter (DMT)-like permease
MTAEDTTPCSTAEVARISCECHALIDGLDPVLTSLFDALGVGLPSMRAELSASAFRARDVTLLLLLALIWGHSFLFIKIAVAAVPPAWLVAMRMLIGGVLLFAVALAQRERIPRDAKSLSTLAVVGLTGGSLPWFGQAWAQHFLDSGLVSVLNACTPLATLVMAVLARQETLRASRIVGIGVAIAGTVIVVEGEMSAGRSLAALVVAVLATTGYAFAAVLTRARVSRRMPNVPAAGLQLLIGGLALVPVAFAFSGPPPTALSFGVIEAVTALGLLGTGLAFLIYFTLIERVGATNAAMVTYLVPIVGLAAGALYRGEHFGANVFVGALALITGVWLAQRQPAM